ncbi:hypothetical protein pipiens_002559 [Culex pipiens pipiens]|uniref:F-box domain-containing protein n=1 Tax=Culex pipiens pipiens TaxID=38569 RepID=A0ABD1DDY4_CULPP
MTQCRSCNASIDTDAEWTVQCSGQCGLSFHVRCSHLTPSQYSAWSDEVGLLWFCPECLPQFNPAVDAIRKSTVTRVEDLETKLDRGLDRVEGLLMGISGSGTNLVQEPNDEVLLPALPTELWELIFQHLNLFTLKTVRLTCRSWNEIVTCCPSISNGYVFKISMPPKAADIRHLRKVLARPGQYTNVKVTLEPFANPFQAVWWKSAWQSFGQTVQILKCKAKNETNPIMMEMLSRMPNLKDFTYSQTPDWRDRMDEMIDDIPSTIRLDHVQRLWLKKTDMNVGMLSIFARIFRKLKVIKFKTRCGPIFMMHRGYEQKCVDLLRANKNTLEEVKLYPTNRILDVLTNFDKIQLKRVSLDYNENVTIGKIIQLTKRQTKIERLHIIVKFQNISALYDIVRNLPNLKSFKFSLPESEAALSAIPTFLSTLTKLETLGIRTLSVPNAEAGFTFGEASLPKLRNFKAILVYFAKDSLPSFVARCPQLRTVLLRNARIHWADFPALVTRAPSLDQLKLLYLEKHCPGQDVLTNVPTQTSNLRHLQLTGCEVPEELVRNVGYLCPKLELLYMSRFPAFREWLRDSTMEELCPTLEHLREIKLYDFEYLSERALECLVENCPGLGKLLLGDCALINEDSARDVLRPLKGAELIFNCAMYKDRKKPRV